MKDGEDEADQADASDKNLISNKDAANESGNAGEGKPDAEGDHV